MLYRLPVAFFFFSFLPLATFAAGPDEVTLVSRGGDPLPIVVSKSASQGVRQSADTLASYLGKMSGAKFAVGVGDQNKAIRVGRLNDFSDWELGISLTWEKGDPTRREDYWLKSTSGGLNVLGTTDLAVEHAVWDLLYRLGYRQFFPGKTWEVIPKRPTISIAVDVHEHPDFYARRIWYGFGAWDYAAKPYQEWCARNRCTSGLKLNTGHAYDGIISRNKGAFQAHPEFLGLLNGERKSTKLCISNPALRELVIQDALAQFVRNPEQDSVSVDPSDGLGWCECEKCQAMGSISDRALTLANAVAEAVNKKYPGKYVGMYAYSAHSPPPNLRVHPQVVTSVATAFIRGGYTVDQLMEGWHQRGATLGVREYLSVNTWDRDLPGKSRGSNLKYVREKIPHFHERGAKFFSAESSDNWGPNGLGYYLAARMLWNADEANQADALVEDFLDKCFGSAKQPMAEFYQLIDGSSQPLMSDHLIGRMYRLLQEARSLTNDEAVQKRLDDLVLYTRYVELWFDYAHSDDEVRQTNFEKWIRHVYRMRETMMVHAKALYRDVVRRDKKVAIPENATWNIPENKNPWKSSKPFTREELNQFVRQGILNRRLRGFESVKFSTNLVPAAKLSLREVPTGKMGLYSRGKRTYYTWVDDPSQSITLTVSGGRIYKDRGDVAIHLDRADQLDRESAKTGEPVDSASVPPDGKERTILLKPGQKGLHVITVSDGGAGTIVQWQAGQPMTVISNQDQPASFHGRWSLYFYVPKNTKIVGGYSSGPGKLLDGNGKLIHTFEDKPGYFRVRVETEQDRKLWKFENCAGQRLLMTVPPGLARSTKELLVPAEIVE